MQPFIPKRFEHVVFGLLLSAMMSFLVTAIANIMGVGMSSPEFFWQMDALVGDQLGVCVSGGAVCRADCAADRPSTCQTGLTTLATCSTE